MRSSVIVVGLAASILATACARSHEISEAGCRGQPPGAPTPFAVFGGRPLHYPTRGRCIDVLIDPTSIDLGAPIRAATRFFDDLGIPYLCFEEPRFSTAPLTAPVAGAFSVRTDPASTAMRALPQVVRSSRGSEVVAFEVVIPGRRVAEASRLETLTTVFLQGLGLGFEDGREGRVTPDDIASLRAMYGEPPHCADIAAP